MFELDAADVVAKLDVLKVDPDADELDEAATFDALLGLGVPDLLLLDPTARLPLLDGPDHRAFLRINEVTWVISLSTSVRSDTSHTLALILVCARCCGSVSISFYPFSVRNKQKDAGTRQHVLRFIDSATKKVYIV